MHLDLSHSWMVGDNLTDVKAGQSAGARTILIGKMKCELCRHFSEENSRPEAVCVDLFEAVKVIESSER
jgi:histidinol phosphatase-like enzyme